MADTRSRRQKLQAIAAPGSGATDGERANAQALLRRLAEPTVAEQMEKLGRELDRATDELHRWNRETADAVDEFLRSYRPGFSNAVRMSTRKRARPIVDVPLEEQPRTASGGRVGTLEFGDALSPGRRQLED